MTEIRRESWGRRGSGIVRFKGDEGGGEDGREYNDRIRRLGSVEGKGTVYSIESRIFVVAVAIGSSISAAKAGTGWWGFGERSGRVDSAAVWESHFRRD